MKCGFIGDRECDEMLFPICREIGNIIRLGVTEFYSNAMGFFEDTCERAVKGYGAKIIYVASDKNKITMNDYIWYDDIMVPKKKAFHTKEDIINTKKWVIRHCDIIFCYVQNDELAKEMYKYATEKNKRIIDLKELI